MKIRRHVLASAAVLVLACPPPALQATPAATTLPTQVQMSATTSELNLVWETTWNHQTTTPGVDGFDVARALAPAAGGIEVFGYAELSDTLSFVTEYASDGSQLNDSFITFIPPPIRAVAETGDLLYVISGGAHVQYLTVYDRADSTWTMPLAITNGSPPAGGWGTLLGAVTAQAGSLYALVDEYVMTRHEYGYILTTTHEIHLRKYEPGITGSFYSAVLVWDKVLTPETPGLLGSDSSGLYVVGEPIYDFGIDPPNQTGPKSVSKLTFDGSLVWTKPLGQDTATSQFGYGSLAVKSDGLYLAGFERPLVPGLSAGPADVLVTKLDTAGNVVWSNTYDADSPSADKWYAKVGVGESGIYIAALLDPPWDATPNDSDVVVLKLAFDGSELATARWGGSGDDNPEDALVVGDAFYVAGNTMSGNPPGGSDAFLLKYTGSDTTPPAIGHVLDPASPDGSNSWYTGDVTLTWTVTEDESPASLVKVDCADQSITADQTATTYACSATSDGGSAGPVTATIKRDATAPNVALVSGPANGASYYYGWVPDAPTCSASDATSGLDGNCAVSGYGSTVGAHTVSAAALDMAGNQASESATYTVLAWTFNGFSEPVDTGANVWNTVKGGSTVPLSFEVFAGATELTDVSAVQGFAVNGVACPVTGVTTEDVELTTTGGTSLRYDATEGQFIQNWKTPRSPGNCYTITMTTQDGSTLSANFQLK